MPRKAKGGGKMQVSFVGVDVEFEELAKEYPEVAKLLEERVSDLSKVVKIRTVGYFYTSNGERVFLTMWRPEFTRVIIESEKVVNVVKKAIFNDNEVRKSILSLFEGVEPLEKKLIVELSEDEENAILEEVSV